MWSALLGAMAMWGRSSTSTRERLLVIYTTRGGRLCLERQQHYLGQIRARTRSTGPNRAGQTDGGVCIGKQPPPSTKRKSNLHRRVPPPIYLTSNTMPVYCKMDVGSLSNQTPRTLMKCRGHVRLSGQRPWHDENWSGAGAKAASAVSVVSSSSRASSETPSMLERSSRAGPRVSMPPSSDANVQIGQAKLRRGVRHWPGRDRGEFIEGFKRNTVHRRERRWTHQVPHRRPCRAGAWRWQWAVHRWRRPPRWTIRDPSKRP